MTSDLRVQLKNTLGAAYTLERATLASVIMVSPYYVDSSMAAVIPRAEAISSRPFDKLRASARFAAAMRRFNLDLSIVTAPDGGRSR